MLEEVREAPLERKEAKSNDACELLERVLEAAEREAEL